METVPVKMSDIRVLNLSELNPAKIRAIENSSESLSSLLHDQDDPIVLYRGTPPYELCDGRHRVYLAEQRGIKLVPAAFN
ncbi:MULTISPECIES: hypothetical protein [unclassified Microcoleus]|uniref:hypothetical protein n=1 Tax=unclassified Microcoleus TaxID=2642155 RepID=UPI001E180987|nr:MULTISPECIES: hypothetical protein [unclassified Microcoleus]MCC3569174.1 hypothetical protein [Microcoleus sp. PH2017_31_RDM_U_A]MCC3581491.1 hypothetical protein [Microcoleus sp. PH2017_32_RDM_D_A]MCC3619473.1 hypothetical protein [Microcoleus sp. PH2017_38_RDM_U_B]